MPAGSPRRVFLIREFLREGEHKAMVIVGVVFNGGLHVAELVTAAHQEITYPIAFYVVAE